MATGFCQMATNVKEIGGGGLHSVVILKPQFFRCCFVYFVGTM